MAAGQRAESLAGTSIGYHTAGSTPTAVDASGAASAIGATMRKVLKRTRDLVRVSRIDTRTLHRPEPATTTALALRLHRPRTNHDRFPRAVVAISESSGVEDPAVRVVAVHVRRGIATAGCACAPLGIATWAAARTNTATTRRRTMAMTSIRNCDAIGATRSSDS